MVDIRVEHRAVCSQETNVNQGTYFEYVEHTSIGPVLFSALVEGSLEKSFVDPSILKVGMHPKTSDVPKREHPTPRDVRELINTDKHLVENADKMNWVSVWTVSSVEILDGVGHMGLVIRTIKVLAVPAARKEDLGAHAVRALVLEEIGAFI